MSASERPRLLAIDPDPSIRALIVAVTRRRGFDTDTAANVEEALQRVRSQKFELIIIEPGIPGGDALLRELADQNVVIATSRADFDRRPNVAAVLRKPFFIEELASIVDAYRPVTA